jgi:tetratricopeptide (TPR) repeat protein
LHVKAGSRLSEQEAYARAVEALEQGQPGTGLEFLQPFVPANPRNYRFWHLHGLLLRALGRRADALQSLRRAVELGPEAPTPAHALARTLYEAGLPSIDAYGRALQLAPADTEVVSGLVTAFISGGEPETAIEGLERILKRSPHWLEGHALLTRLRWTQGERHGFTRSFDEALRVLPGDINLRREQIISLVHAEHWDDVLRAISDGRAAVGDQMLFDVNEAIVHSETGDVARAEPLFAPYLDSSDSSVQIRIVRHYLRSGRPGEADRVIGRWIDHPDSFAFWPYASLAWRMLDDPRWQWLEGDDRFIGVYDIADRLPPLDVLAETLRNLHTFNGQPLEQSLRGGTQTEGNIFTHIDPVLEQLREAIRATVAEHVAQLPPHDPAHPLLSPRRDSIEFSGAWSVWLREQGFHANHVHPAGWISSALYIVLPPDLGENESGFLTIGEPESPTLKLGLPPFRTIEPKPGRLALFPSYTWHGTRPFGRGERMTVAFDVARPN